MIFFTCFSELTSLDLFDVTFLPQSPPLSPSFTLHCLQLIGEDSLIPLPLLPALVSSSIHHLTIDLTPFENHVQLCDSFISIAAHLRSLYLFRLPPPSIHNIFNNCITVRQLKIKLVFGDSVSQLVQLLASFPDNIITTLKITRHTSGASRIKDFLAGLLKSRTLMRLRQLSIIAGVSRSGVLSNVGGEQVFQKWEERGVKIYLS